MALYEEVLVSEHSPSFSGKTITVLRQSRGLTREELDTELDFPSGYFWLFEIGRRYATPRMIEGIKEIQAMNNNIEGRWE